VNYSWEREWKISWERNLFYYFWCQTIYFFPSIFLFSFTRSSRVTWIRASHKSGSSTSLRSTRKACLNHTITRICMWYKPTCVCMCNKSIILIYSGMSLRVIRDVFDTVAERQANNDKVFVPIQFLSAPTMQLLLPWLISTEHNPYDWYPVPDEVHSAVLLPANLPGKPISNPHGTVKLSALTIR
jgi:hypothetical protein